MSQKIDDKISEMDILCGEKNSPPHTQQSQMATEFTSSETKENTLSKFTASSSKEVPVRPIEGVTDSSGPHDEIITNFSSLGSLCPNNSSNTAVATVGGPQSKIKRKHRRGKPKTKKPYKKTNWKFQVPRYGSSQSGGFGGGGGSSSNSNMGSGRRIKLNRSRSLVPYNTNKFLMEEHLAEVPSALLTPSDDEEFLAKEFTNVYEKARVDQLETLTKQQLIEECLQIEDRYSEQGAQRQQQLNAQKISSEHLSKIRQLEEKIRELTRENYDLRRQMALSSATATAITQNPTPMDSSSEDSESDSSSSSSKSSSSSESSLSEYSDPVEPKLDSEMAVDASANAEEEDTNEVAQCNGYHSAGSETLSSSPTQSRQSI